VKEQRSAEQTRRTQQAIDAMFPGTRWMQCSCTPDHEWVPDVLGPNCPFCGEPGTMAARCDN